MRPLPSGPTTFAVQLWLGDAKAHQSRTLVEGSTLTFGSRADVPLKDPFSRSVYCSLVVAREGLLVSSRSRARGVWVYQLESPAEQLLALEPELAFAHFEASVPDPVYPRRLWIRGERGLHVLRRAGATRLTLDAEGGTLLVQRALLALPGANALVERELSHLSGSREFSASSLGRDPVRTHSAAPSLEERIAQCDTPDALAAALQGVVLDGAGGGAPEATFWAPSLQGEARAESFASLAPLLEALRAHHASRARPVEEAVLEVPLVLAQNARGVQPYALLLACGREQQTALLYPLQEEGPGTTTGALVAARFGAVAQLAHGPLAPRPSRPSLSTAASALEPWDERAFPGAGQRVEPALRAWGEHAGELEALLAPYLDARIAAAGPRLWPQLVARTAELAGGSLHVQEAALEAAAVLAFRRDDPRVAGLAAHQTLWRRLCTLAEDGVALRKLSPAALLDLVELGALGLNHNVIGDDNRQKLLHRLAQWLAFLAPSQAQRGRRVLLLPSGCLAELDAEAAERQEKWAREGAPRKGDRRLLEALSEPLAWLEEASSQWTRLGFAPEAARAREVRLRVERARGEGEG